jgi:hypothetical protein
VARGQQEIISKEKRRIMKRKGFNSTIRKRLRENNTMREGNGKR